MASDVFDIVLLLALPASGKSEVRNFFAHIGEDRLREEFHIGKTLQLDDFPYVHFMRRIDDELCAMGTGRLFYPGEAPFLDGRDWGTLCGLLNEDYHDLMNRSVTKPDSAARLLFDRIDRAAAGAGIAPRLGLLPDETRARLAVLLENEARTMLDDKHAGYPETFEGATVVIECARGGPDGAQMPLAGTFGYQYSLPMFCPEILQKASVLYLLVTPEESRRKNSDRADPNDPGSNLHHGVPLAVMLGDYGCDDMAYLIGASDRPHTIAVAAHGSAYHLPVGVFDNRVDKTSFLRERPESWDPARIAEVTDAIRAATDDMRRGER